VGNEDDRVTSLAKGVRLDLVIAVCALLISSLATAASWWQTRVIQEQLSAQVWPYVGINVGQDNNKVAISLDNDGLGPAVLRNVSIAVDGKSQRTFIDILHVLLGPGIAARKPAGELMRLDQSLLEPGAVLRAGTSTEIFAFTSKHFTPMLAAGLAKRATIRICYCAILSGTCWLTASDSSTDPQPLGACPTVTDDWLHASLSEPAEATTY
jgi:hypothetical protein